MARPIGPQQLDGPAGRIDASSKGWMGLVKLLPRLVVKRPRPRDTLNDDDEFTTPSPRTFALRLAAAARADLRRVARVSYQVWRTHMRACVAESHFVRYVRGRVSPGAPAPRLLDNSARNKKAHVFVPWIPSDRFFFFMFSRGFFAPVLIFLRTLLFSRVIGSKDKFKSPCSRTTGRARSPQCVQWINQISVVSRERGTHADKALEAQQKREKPVTSPELDQWWRYGM